MAQAKRAEENKQNQESQQNQTQNQQNMQGQQNQGQQGMVTRVGNQQQGLSRQSQFASPFSFMRRFSEEMDRLFDDFAFGGMSRPSFGRGLMSPGFGREFEQMSRWSPQTEVFQRGSELVVRADLPGMTKDQVNVELEQDQIIIQGERREERESDEGGFYQTERSYGSFYRAIPLPEGVDGEQAKANFNNGVLEITMPMPEQKSGRRRLEIGEGGSQQGGQEGGRAQGKSAG
jgi:HSP20 family protein